MRAPPVRDDTLSYCNVFTLLAIPLCATQKMTTSPVTKPIEAEANEVVEQRPITRAPRLVGVLLGDREVALLRERVEHFLVDAFKIALQEVDAQDSGVRI